jgi:hypothetical protein
MLSTNLLRSASQSVDVDSHIVAIVPDRQRFAMWLKSDTKAPFPILMDIDNGYAMSLGLAIHVGDALKQMMVSSGWDPADAPHSRHLHRRH